MSLALSMVSVDAMISKLNDDGALATVCHALRLAFLASSVFLGLHLLYAVIHAVASSSLSELSTDVGSSKIDWYMITPLCIMVFLSTLLHYDVWHNVQNIRYLSNGDFG